MLDFFRPAIAVIVLAGVIVLMQIVVDPFAILGRDDTEEEARTRTSAKVAHVIDGDTFVLKDNVRVRLLGIDTPEQGDCYYEEARDALEGMIDGNEVSLVRDISETDAYGRKLRYVYFKASRSVKEPLFVNEYMVQNGYARVLVIAPDTGKEGVLAEAEQSAKKAQRGLWYFCR